MEAPRGNEQPHTACVTRPSPLNFSHQLASIQGSNFASSLAHKATGFTQAVSRAVRHSLARLTQYTMVLRLSTPTHRQVSGLCSVPTPHSIPQRKELAPCSMKSCSAPGKALLCLRRMKKIYIYKKNQASNSGLSGL